MYRFASLLAEEQFDNDSLPLVVISPQSFAGHNAMGHGALGNPHHGQTISIIPGPAMPETTAAMSNSISTGLNLSHVDLVQSLTNGTTAAAALSSNQKSTNAASSLEVTPKKILVNQQSVFLNHHHPHTASYPAGEIQGQASIKAVGVEGGSGLTVTESIIKSTNMMSSKMPHTLLANGLASSSSASATSMHFHGAPTDKPEDLSSHLTFTTNGYAPPSSSSVSLSGETVNILSKTTGNTTTTTLVTAAAPVAAPKPVINLRDLTIDPQQLQNVQQPSIYDIVYQKGAQATATATGRRRTISNNSTG